MSGGYDINDLLTLAVSEQADGLSVNAGQPPLVRLRGETRAVEGPAMSPENADSLLRKLAGTRHMREFRKRGAVAFIYTLQDSTQFQVEARLDHDEIQIDLQRLVA